MSRRLLVIAILTIIMETEEIIRILNVAIVRYRDIGDVETSFDVGTVVLFTIFLSR